MIQAFHYVAGGRVAIRRIWKDRELLPAQRRLDLGPLREGCLALAREVEEEGNPELGHAIARLSDFRSRNAGRGPRRPVAGAATKFECADFLAGDLGFVFLSLGQWNYWDPKDRENGFVYDAAELVKFGALVREEDYGRDYATSLRGLGAWRFSSPRRWDTALRAVLERISGSSLSGEAARDVLDAADLAGHWPESFQDPELLCPGALSMDYATQIWVDGRQVGPGELDR